MPHPAFKIQRSTFNIQNSPCHMPRLVRANNSLAAAFAAAGKCLGNESLFLAGPVHHIIKALAGRQPQGPAANR